MKLKCLKILIIIVLMINNEFYINEIYKIIDIKRKVKAEFLSENNREIDIGFIDNTRIGLGVFSFDKDGYYYGTARLIDKPEIEFPFRYFNYNGMIDIDKHYYLAMWNEEYKKFLNDILKDNSYEISNVEIKLSYNIEEYKKKSKGTRGIYRF